uniref:Transposase n=1 Tax=Acrobeloides nanus TaxID=290746 RepID=A0A914DWL6_9BILA
MGKKDVWTVAAALGIPTRRRPIAQGRRNPEFDPRQRARVHRKAEACSKPHQSVEALKKSLVKAWNAIPQEVIDRIVNDFPKRLKKCIDARGDHFENK